MSESIGLPQFSSINVQGFEPHLKAMLKKHLDQINALLTVNHHFTWDNLMYPLENLDDELERFWSPFAHLHSVMDSPALRECYEQCVPLLSAYESAIGQNQKLYKAIKSIDVSSLSLAQRKIIEDAMLGFELSGVGLGKSDKKRFEQIQIRLNELSSQFENNVLDATQAFTLPVSESGRLNGLPEHALNYAQELALEKGLTGSVLTLEFPCYQAVMTYAEDRSLREEIYKAYITRASDQGPESVNFDNTPLISELLALRHEKALLLGFNNFAELSLATKMAQSPDEVVEFMEDLVEKTSGQASKEFKELEEFAKRKYSFNTVQPWDLAYLSEKRRQDLFSLSQEELRPYFPEFQVMEGLFAIIKKLYGMKVERIEGVDIWHADVQCYAIIDKFNKTRGFIYTDLYARPNKRGGAWMDSLQSRRKLEYDKIQVPIATLTCNFAKASANKPAMLSHDEVITLFHEFGHCLHHILTQVDYLGLGINSVEWDAVELPSQFFENWCWQQEALSLLTSHIETKEPLSPVLFEGLMAAKNFQSAIAILRQMEFSLFDFLIHKNYEENNLNLIPEILEQVRAKTALISAAPYNRFQHSFSHIFGGPYAAGYYSYIWAEVLSSDAFSRFEEEGIFNQKTGLDFLNFILEVGGTKKASEAYLEFRGRPATIDALLRHNGIQRNFSNN